MKTAVITGASSGLGVEFAKAVASLCPEAEEIWLIARRGEKLAQVASLLKGKRTFVLPMDLTDIDGYGKLREALEEKKPDIVSPLLKRPYLYIGICAILFLLGRGVMFYLGA